VSHLIYTPLARAGVFLRIVASSHRFLAVFYRLSFRDPQPACQVPHCVGSPVPPLIMLPFEPSLVPPYRRLSSFPEPSLQACAALICFTPSLCFSIHVLVKVSFHRAVAMSFVPSLLRDSFSLLASVPLWFLPWKRCRAPRIFSSFTPSFTVRGVLCSRDSFYLLGTNPS